MLSPLCRIISERSISLRIVTSGPGNSSGELVREGGGNPVSDSSIPSSMLEQDAQMFGFLENSFAPGTIGSPQQMQIRGFIPSANHQPICRIGNCVSKKNH
jgi:hypothetical protein